MQMENNYPFISMLRKYVSSSVLLVFATVAALVIANSPWGDLYRQFWEQPVSVSIGSFNFFSHNGHPMSLGAFINDFLMAIFFQMPIRWLFSALHQNWLYIPLYIASLLIGIYVPTLIAKNLRKKAPRYVRVCFGLP